MYRGSDRSAIPPLGGVGAQFNISPRSSSSSEDESDSPPILPQFQSPRYGAPRVRADISHIATTRIVVESSFTVEPYSDEDGDLDTDVLKPSGIESPGSDRSRSRSGSPREMDPKFINEMDRLNPFDSDDSDLGHEDEIMAAIRQQRKAKRIRRMTQGSTISKRTVSERGSDSDREDLQPFDMGDPVTRRTRRKLSISPEIILEVREPNSDDEDDAELLARELPFYELMVVDSDQSD